MAQNDWQLNSSDPKGDLSAPSDQTTLQQLLSEEIGNGKLSSLVDFLGRHPEFTLIDVKDALANSTFYGDIEQSHHRFMLVEMFVTAEAYFVRGKSKSKGGRPRKGEPTPLQKYELLCRYTRELSAMVSKKQKEQQNKETWEAMMGDLNKAAGTS